MDKRIFRENSMIFEPTQNSAIDQDGFTETEDASWKRDIAKIALPNESPKPISLERLPESLRKSAAMNSLIQQNEDLLSRLNVALRRYAKLEHQIEELKESVEHLTEDNQSLKDIALIHQNKAHLVEDRVQETVQKYEDLKNNNDLLETRYAELYSRSQKQINDLEGQSQKAIASEKRLARYRQRILKLGKHVRAHIENLESRNLEFERDFAVLKESYQGLKERMTATAEHLQNQEKAHIKQIADLTDSYEKQVEDKNHEMRALNSEIDELRQEARQNVELREKLTTFENDLVFYKRRIADIKSEHSKSTEEIHKQLTTYRLEAKNRTLEIESLKEDQSQIQDELDQKVSENSKLKDQIESLQLVWNSGHLELEKEKQKNQSLQKLNQQISLSLNEARHETSKTQNKFDTFRMETSQKISELEKQLQFLLSEKRKNDPKKLKTPSEPENSEAISRIQNLIHEVQSGSLASSEEQSAE